MSNFAEKHMWIHGTAKLAQRVPSVGESVLQDCPVSTSQTFIVLYPLSSGVQHSSRPRVLWFSLQKALQTAPAQHLVRALISHETSATASALGALLPRPHSVPATPHHPTSLLPHIPLLGTPRRFPLASSTHTVIILCPLTSLMCVWTDRWIHTYTQIGVRSDFALQSTSGNDWGHCGSSQLTQSRGSVCAWHLLSRGQACG